MHSLNSPLRSPVDCCGQRQAFQKSMRDLDDLSVPPTLKCRDQRYEIDVGPVNTGEAWMYAAISEKARSQ